MPPEIDTTGNSESNKQDDEHERQCRYCPVSKATLDGMLIHLQGAHGVQNPFPERVDGHHAPCPDPYPERTEGGR